MALAVVGSPHGQNTTGTGTVTSDSWTSTAGTLIANILPTFNTAGAAASGDSTDSASNAWTLVTHLFGGASATGIAAYYQNGGTRGASYTTTVNLLNSGGENSNLGTLEISGHDTGTPLDSTTFATATGTGTSPAVTTAAAVNGNQIVLVGIVTDSGVNDAITQDATYTLIKEQENGSTSLASNTAYKIVANPGTTLTHTWTLAASHTWRAIIVTFKEAAAAGGFVRPTIVVPTGAVQRAASW